MKKWNWLAPIMAGLCLVSAERAAAQYVAPAPPAPAQAPVDKPLMVKNVFGLENNARLRSPVYNVNGGGKIVRPNNAAVREWVQVVAEYYTSNDIKNRWLNQIAFQFYVLCAIDNRETKSKEYTVFRGTVTYMDIDRRNRDARWATMFLRPSALVRYGDPIAVAVEATVDGRLVETKAEVDRRAQEMLSREKEWWKNPKLTVKDGYLLKAEDTPFSYIQYDDFEESVK